MHTQRVQFYSEIKHLTLLRQRVILQFTNSVYAVIQNVEKKSVRCILQTATEIDCY